MQGAARVRAVQGKERMSTFQSRVVEVTWSLGTPLALRVDAMMIKVSVVSRKCGADLYTLPAVRPCGM